MSLLDFMLKHNVHVDDLFEHAIYQNCDIMILKIEEDEICVTEKDIEKLRC